MPDEYLEHFNKNHDPKTGRFSSALSTIRNANPVNQAVVVAGLVFLNHRFANGALKAANGKPLKALSMSAIDAGNKMRIAGKALVRMNTVTAGKAAVAGALAAIGGRMIYEFKIKGGA